MCVPYTHIMNDKTVTKASSFLLDMTVSTALAVRSLTPVIW